MKLKIGLAGVDQVCFTGDKGAVYNRAKTGLKKLAERTGFELYCVEDTIITRSQAEKVAGEMKAEGVDFVLVQNSSFAAGETILPFAGLKLPMGLWAVPEPASKGLLPLNSFCGLNMYASITVNYLKEHDIKYKWFFGHPEDEQFVKRLSITVKALTAAKRLRNSRIAHVGGIAPGFNDLYYDERLIEKRFGIDIQRLHEYAELRDMAVSYADEEIAEYIEKSSRGYRASCASKDEMNMSARFLKAYDDFAAQNNYDAVAISCWPKIQSDFGLCSCHTIARLNELGVPAACEGDIPGAVGMLLLKYISDDKETTLMDLVAYDKGDETLQFWHCGPTTPSFAGQDGVELMTLEEDTASGGKRYLKYIHDMTFKPGDATVLCLANEFKSAFILNGRFIDGSKDKFRGSAGWLGELKLNGESAAAEDVVNTILVQGISHHYPIVYGDYGDILRELCVWLDMSLIDKIPYRDFVQRPSYR